MKIWAPHAKQVELVSGARRFAAHPIGDGYWEVSSPPIDAEYSISLDGGPPRPDPRSRSQPHGVHGPSRWLEHPCKWTDTNFKPTPLSQAVIYELHVGTFTPEGTLDAALARLDDLITLGVTHVELMPLSAFPGRRGWGYDGVGLYAVHRAYGGIEALCRFVDGAHAKHVSVLLDVVYNHLGPDGNYLGEFGPYFTEKHKTPWGPAIDFTQRGVRRFFLDNAIFWLRDCHLDGLRLDATHAIFDPSEPHVLQQLADEVKALPRPAVLIAENEDNDPRLVASQGLDAFWFDDLHHAIHAAFTGEKQGYYAHYGKLADIATALLGKGTLNGRPLGPRDGSRCVACIQNHDQIGNRALGDRLAQLVSPGRARLAAALMFTSPFVPLIFQGEEWGASSPFQYFTDHQDPALARAVSEGRKQEHASVAGEVPDPQDPQTMRRSTLDWSERARPPHREMLEWYRSLIALRRRLPELTDGRRDQVHVSVDEDDGLIIVKRGRVTLVGNIGTKTLRFSSDGRLELSFPELQRRGAETSLPPDSCAVWVNRD